MGIEFNSRSLKLIVQYEGIILPPPPPSEKGYKSQFFYKAFGRSFWVYEHKLKASYCQEGIPLHVVTVEQ